MNYFAIGSMMNKVSLKGRELEPIESHPAIIQDFSLHFFGKSGMAEAVACEGGSFHGVLHKMTASDMEKLDKIEFTYDRSTATVKLYDGTVITDATVYVHKTSMDFGDVHSPPSERYLDLLMDGCKQHGVEQSYIDWLKTHEVIPRRKPEEFVGFPLPEGLPTWTMEQVAAGDGKDGHPIYYAMNGKVREYIGPPGTFSHHVALSVAGHHAELFICKMLYEPKYGMHDKIECFTREHCAYIEDFSATGATKGTNGEELYRVVALIEQQYVD